MEINQITQMIIEFTPIITALIGILVSVIVGIRRIKNSNAKTISELRSSNDQLVQHNEQLAKDNAELMEANRQLREDMQILMLELHDIHIKNKKNK